MRHWFYIFQGREYLECKITPSICYQFFFFSCPIKVSPNSRYLFYLSYYIFFHCSVPCLSTIGSIPDFYYYLVGTFTDVFLTGPSSLVLVCQRLGHYSTPTRSLSLYWNPCSQLIPFPLTISWSLLSIRPRFVTLSNIKDFSINRVSVPTFDSGTFSSSHSPWNWNKIL